MDLSKAISSASASLRDIKLNNKLLSRKADNRNVTTWLAEQTPQPRIAFCFATLEPLSSDGNMTGCSKHEVHSDQHADCGDFMVVGSTAQFLFVTMPSEAFILLKNLCD